MRNKFKQGDIVMLNVPKNPFPNEGFVFEAGNKYIVLFGKVSKPGLTFHDCLYVLDDNGERVVIQFGSGDETSYGIYFEAITSRRKMNRFCQGDHVVINPATFNSSIDDFNALHGTNIRLGHRYPLRIDAKGKAIIFDNNGNIIFDNNGNIIVLQKANGEETDFGKHFDKIPNNIISAYKPNPSPAPQVNFMDPGLEVVEKPKCARYEVDLDWEDYPCTQPDFYKKIREGFKF